MKRISIVFVLLALHSCRDVTIPEDAPQGFEGFLQIAWGWSLDNAREHLLAHPPTRENTALSNNTTDLSVFDNVSFCGIRSDQCILKCPGNSFSEAQLQFFRIPDNSIQLFDSLKTILQKQYGQGMLVQDGIDWFINRKDMPQKRGRIRLTRIPDGSIILSAIGEYHLPVRTINR